MKQIIATGALLIIVIAAFAGVGLDRGGYRFVLATLLADLNCDGAVNGFDLMLLVSAWGECPDHLEF